MGDLFSEALQKAMSKTLPVAELFGAAGELQRQGNPGFAATLYREWIRCNEGDPLLHAVNFNYSVVLNELRDYAGARDALQEAVRIAPQFFPAHINLGSAFERLGDALSAVNQWFGVVNMLGQINGETLSYKKTAFKQIARVLEGANCEEKAEECLRMSIEIDSTQRDVAQHWLAIRQKQVKWPVVTQVGPMGPADLKRIWAPLTAAVYTDDPLLQLATAYESNRIEVGRPASFYKDGDFEHLKGAPDRKLRVGYVSSDFRGHAVGYLTVGMFGLHDRDKVEVWAYYCGPAADDEISRRIRGTVDQWHDVMGMDQAAIAKMIYDHQIDILIDLNGYTNFGLFKMFSMRPAPVVVNWLGFPGTMGSPYHHYIIADPTIIPPGSEMYYTEKVLRLPCYQPNDRTRVVAAESPTRAQVGLPEDAVVLCCFNGAQKLTPATFARWAEILHQVPNAVLWLLKGGENSDAHLRELAPQFGIDPARIYFAERQANAQHMARYPLADLFLDTLPYGAHTTASDALWMGVPVVTIAGRGFAARVCASLVSSAGAPELVCASPEEYIAKAVELARDPAKRQEIRDRLLADRLKSVTFDTELLVRSIEDLYRTMYHDFLRGEVPRPDLANLDVYQEIGIEGTHEAEEYSFIPDYHERYVRALAERDAFAPLKPDTRLWKK